MSKFIIIQQIVESLKNQQAKFCKDYCCWFLEVFVSSKKDMRWSTTFVSSTFEIKFISLYNGVLGTIDEEKISLFFVNTASVPQISVPQIQDLETFHLGRKIISTLTSKIFDHHFSEITPCVAALENL